ncbi:MAG: hypothetical protein FH749_12420 [Firmicutes bacterium]|nr:hypothetical protein [Bacillota bacterium]
MGVSEQRANTKSGFLTKKTNIYGLIVITAILGVVLFLGSGFVLAYLAEDAANTAVDEVKELLPNLETQEEIDVAREAWDNAAELVEDLKEGTVRDGLLERLAGIQQVIDETQEALDIAMAKLAAEEAATEAVGAVQGKLETIESQEQIDAAREAYEAARLLVEDLHDGDIRAALLEQIAAIDTLLETVQEQFDAEVAATEAVEEVEALLSDLSSQSRVNAAQSAYDAAYQLVEELPEGDVQEQLHEQLEEILEEIDEAQEELHRKAEEAATEAVERAESRISNLSNQGAINSANSAYSPANNLVRNLHDGSVKDSLSSRINAVKSAIDQAQQQLNAKWAEVRLNFNRQRYTYSNLTNDLQKLAGHYPDLASTAVVGQSVEGRNIWSITVGKGSRDVLVLGSLHASEWMTTPVVMRTVETLLWEYDQNITVSGESVKDILDKYSITFIPMVNPDGVTLVQQGVSAFPDRAEELLALNGNWGEDFSRWKANIRGVDINRNFDVRWSTQPGQSENPDPYYAWHPGPSAESEPETRAVANWVRSNNPELLLDYHSFGEILFWWYLQSGSQLNRDRAIVTAMRNYSGFRMEGINHNADPSSTSTYWGSRVIGIPSITVELGNRYPRLLGMGDLNSMFGKVRYLPLIGIMNLPSY